MRMLVPVAAFTILSSAAMGADVSMPPSGHYVMDPSHTSITFKVSHLGFSRFTGRIDKMSGDLDFDAAKPEASKLDASLNAASIDTNVSELDESLQSENWFDVLKFPAMTFHATRIDMTGKNSAKITGDFTMHGVTHTVVLDTVLVGQGKMPFVNKQVMGLSASGTLSRAAYGINNGEPMIGDKVAFQIETEFDKSE